jgi:hypothetical protein
VHAKHAHAHAAVLLLLLLLLLLHVLHTKKTRNGGTRSAPLPADRAPQQRGRDKSIKHGKRAPVQAAQATAATQQHYILQFLGLHGGLRPRLWSHRHCTCGCLHFSGTRGRA